MYDDNQDSAQEEGYYYWTICKFENLVEEFGVAQVMNDMTPFVRTKLIKWVEENT